MFEIDTTPFPARRIVASKYDEMFSEMRPGQCIKTESDNVGKVCAAMKKWLERKGRTDVVVRSVRRMDDGYGRVYMMPTKPLKMADVKGRVVSKLEMNAS